MKKGNEKFYITTAIAYASRKPHIGNVYEIILTDAIARYKRMTGKDVFFLTGTDEHGLKIQQLAEGANKSPKEYVDGVAGEIKELWDMFNISYDKFIRTTDDDHVKAVQNIFKKLYEKGDIYKGAYEGMYCTPCESFWTESQLKEGCCPDCGGKVNPAKEDAYFLKLSKYADQLVAYYEANPDFIVPQSRKNEMLNNFIKPGLQDLCVSRSTFTWGVPVPVDNGHVVYVWLDALANYITALGYDTEENSDLYRKNWPAELHVVGKDIVRFHTIYWPIILMALGEPLPKQVLGHPWLLSGDDKMSKSKGNVLYGDDLIKLFGLDAVRYYLLSEMSFGNDGSITYEALINRFNSDLANTLGNLVSRTVSMIQKYFGGVIPAVTVEDEEPEKTLKKAIMEGKAAMMEHMEGYRTSDALDDIFTFVKALNKYIDETMPWALAKDEEKKPRLAAVMANLVEGIRFAATLLSPFMPDTSKKIGEIYAFSDDEMTLESLEMTYPATNRETNKGEILFARIDEKKFFEQL
ncbi:MAG: methionine--tRNA ligase [Ruminococcaceae bacterium]|nr:methionine--tRNA ligase [Oscillospiraceae bacterium]